MVERCMEIEIQIANAFTAHCRPRACGRQRAVSQPSKNRVDEKKYRKKNASR